MRAKRKNVCQVCRSRKLACDGKQPQCSQCVLRCIPCSGYRQEFIFVSQSSSQRDAEPLPRAKHIETPRLSVTPENSALKRPRPADSDWASETRLARAGMKSYELEDDIQFVVDYFAPVKDTGPPELNPYHDQICGVWVGMIPHLSEASRNKDYFRSAVKTLATSLRRHGFKSRRCEPDMLEIYGESIEKLGTALEEARGSFEVDLGVAILCLAVADIMIPTSKSDWMVHVNGIGNLIESLGPASFADGTLHTLFVGLRPMLLISSIANRHDTFVAHDEWSTCLFRGGQSSMLQRLINRAVKLPGLLSRFDKMGTFAGPPNVAATTQLRDDFRDFVKSLWEWERNVRSANPHPMYWFKPSCMESPLTTKNILWYPNIMTANSLTYCWAFEIIARTNLAFLESETQSDGLPSDERRTSRHMPIEFREQRPVAVLADMICNSMSYLLQSEFKLYGPGSAFFTLPTAMRVFQAEPDRYRSQIVRCQGTIEHLAGIGVFFPKT